MFLSWMISIVLLCLTVLLHFEGLAAVSAISGRLNVHLRLRLIGLMLCMFVLHMAEVLVFAAALYLVSNVVGGASLEGQITYAFRDFIYYSVVSYTSLGLGDMVPLGGLRLITGLEALIGLMMITWSASFSVVYMQRFWAFNTSPAAESR